MCITLHTMSTQYVPMWNCDWVMYRLNNSAYKCVSQQEYDIIHQNEEPNILILTLTFCFILMGISYLIFNYTNLWNTDKR